MEAGWYTLVIRNRTLLLGIAPGMKPPNPIEG